MAHLHAILHCSFYQSIQRAIDSKNRYRKYVHTSTIKELIFISVREGGARNKFVLEGTMRVQIKIICLLML